MSGQSMDWSQHSIPAMRLEARFGDRVVPAFCERPNSIWAMIADAAAQNPDGEALVCGERRMSWREVVRQSAQIAAGFQKLGLRSGDRVAVLLGNRIEFVLTLFAAAHAGLVTVLLSTRQQKPEIAYVLTDCGARVLIHEAGLADRLPDAGDVPDLEHRVAVDDDPSVSQFSSLTGHAPLPAPADVGEEDTAMILYTSGTTGKPKGAMLAHCNVIHSAMVFVSCLQLTAADRSIAAVPLGHVTGVVANIMTMVRCARRADHHARIQGRGIPEGGGARTRHLHRDGAGDVQSLPAAAGFRQHRSVELADRRLWRRADADRHDRKAGCENSRPEARELLWRDRDHVAVDHDARRIDRKPYRQRRPAVSRRRSRGHGCARPRAAARRDRRALDPLGLGHQGLLE